MSFGDGPDHGENLRGQSQQQALQAMLQNSVNAYMHMLNSAALLPFLLYQQSLAMATQVARGGLSAATRVSPQETQEVAGGDRIARGTEGTLQRAGVDTSRAVRPDVEVDDEITPDNAEASTQGTRNLQQSVEVADEIRVSGAETTDRSLPEVDATGPPDSVPSPSSKTSEESDTVDEVSDSPMPPDPDEPTARAVYEADRGSVEASDRAEGEIDEASAGPSSTTSPTADREEPVVADEPPHTGGVMELSPPPEVPDVELSPPPPVQSNILEELPQLQDEQPTAQSARGEKPRIHVRKGTAAARRTAEELSVDLDEVEGTGRNGQITVGDVRKKAADRKP